MTSTETKFSVSWTIEQCTGGFMVVERLGFYKVSYGPVPDRNTADALILERRGMIQKLLMEQVAAFEAKYGRGGRVVQ